MRPTWNAVTMIGPKANVSGSTFRRMLAGGVGVRIGAELGERNRCRREDHLYRFRVGRSRSAAQGERNKKSREEALTHSTNRREEHSVESCESNHRSCHSGDAVMRSTYIA